MPKLDQKSTKWWYTIYIDRTWVCKRTRLPYRTRGKNWQGSWWTEADGERGGAGDRVGGKQYGEGRGGNDGISMDADVYQREVLWWVYQFLSFLLSFDKHKIKIKLSAECTSKTNTYIVLRMIFFRYFGSSTLKVPLNPNSTPPFEGKYCQSHSFSYCGSSRLLVTLNPNPTFPFEGNSCQRNRNSCQLPKILWFLFLFGWYERNFKKGINKLGI